MKEREATMPHALQSPRPAAQAKALRGAGIAIAFASGVRTPLRSIAEQLIRAAASVPANIAEGQGRSGKDRLYHWRIASGSAREVEVHLGLLLEAGAVDSERAAEALGLFDEVRAMLWRMMHPL